MVQLFLPFKKNVGDWKLRKFGAETFRLEKKQPAETCLDISNNDLNPCRISVNGYKHTTKHTWAKD